MVLSQVCVYRWGLDGGCIFHSCAGGSCQLSTMAGHCGQNVGCR